MAKLFGNIIIFSLLFLFIMNNVEDTRKIPRGSFKKKMTALEMQLTEINTLFLGSSMTNGDIDPHLYDSLMANYNQQTKSFNLGLHGLNLLESQYILEKLLTMQFANLKTVFLEVNDYLLFLNSANHRSTRIINYHDLKRTFIVCQAIWQTSYPIGLKLRLSRDRLNLFAKHILRTGELKHIYQSYSLQQKIFPDTLKNYNGYAEGGGRNNRFQNRNQFFRTHEGQQDYQVRLNGTHKQMLKSQKHYRQTQLAAIQILSNIISLCRSRGVNIVLINLPANGEKKFIIKNLELKQIDCPLIEMNVPAEYPELFAPENRFDHNHLNDAGAILATKIIAELSIHHLNN